MTSKILIIGSTGVLGSKLLKYCHNQNINIYAITCYLNIKKLNSQKKKYNIPFSFCLSNKDDNIKFIKFINTKKFKLIYFLDFGSPSLKYLDIILKYNSGSIIPIANKEIIIAGGSFLIKKIKISKNILIPLDSEHFSLFRLKPYNKEIKKIYITASGGPFYFKKNINIDKVKISKVLAHPKWKMGINNLIDSSNFINKILEIFELSIIYQIDINKIDFLVSKEAFIHSYVIFEDNTITLNGFSNDMLIPLIKPLTDLYNSNQLKLKSNNYLKLSNYQLDTFRDNRFKISKYFKTIKKFNHRMQIKFMILNNIAQKKYLNGSLTYPNIFEFIMSNIKKSENEVKISNFNDILMYIKFLEKNYEKN